MEFRENAKTFVKLGYTDMRKQINGLSALVQEERNAQLFDGSYYVFCGKSRRLIKILYWDKTGFCLWHKRLEEEFFPWPKQPSELNEITRENIRLLLAGIDVWKEHVECKYQRAV